MFAILKVIELLSACVSLLFIQEAFTVYAVCVENIVQ